VLSFGRARGGVRTYLAIAGGLDVPVVLGSRSTFTRTGLGGYQGRSIGAGDRLAAMTTSADTIQGRALAGDRMPAYGHRHQIRVMPGPQDDAFTAAGHETFLSAEYVVSPKSDRIGCRLDGLPIEHRSGADIVSDGTPFGAIQVAGDGLPIILMADRGTTGGYAKIATVIRADLSRVAQALPGDRVEFRAVSQSEALVALREQEATLQRLAQTAGTRFVRRHVAVRLDSTTYPVSVGFTPQRGLPTAAPVAAPVTLDLEQPSGRRRVEVEVRASFSSEGRED
jgi:biotin-dependent carboxylase-like uncharacterized protein